MPQSEKFLQGISSAKLLRRKIIVAVKVIVSQCCPIFAVFCGNDLSSQGLTESSITRLCCARLSAGKLKDLAGGELTESCRKLWCSELRIDVEPWLLFRVSTYYADTHFDIVRLQAAQ